MKNSTKIMRLKIVAFILTALTFLPSCEPKDGPCQSQLKWELESNSSSEIAVKINNKDHNVDLTVSGLGTIVFRCKNKKEKIYDCSISMDDKWIPNNGPDKSECFNEDCSQFNNSIISVTVDRDSNTATFVFKEMPDKNLSIRVFIGSLEVGTYFNISVFGKYAQS